MPEERKYRKPVAWLGGRDLLANLKYFLLFAAFKGKLDPRDWMRAETFPLGDGSDPKYFEKLPRDNEDEFWFDYFADSGDGMTAGYALAYLCMTDVHARVTPEWETLSPVEKEQHLAAGEIRSRLDAGQKPSSIARRYRGRASQEILDQLAQNKPCKQIIEFIESKTAGVISVAKPGEPAPPGYARLPRGAFLFVGGDTSYHVADFAGLGQRFQQVFDWAYDDLKTHLNPDAGKQIWLEENRRPIFGVPGNHDYYDMIDGFNRQFCRPVTGETRFINLAGRNLFPQLRTWPFKRAQTASYVAIKLPFGWWFWGVDSELRRVDLRQQEYFKRSYYSALSEPAKKALREEIIQRMTKEFGTAPTEEDIEMRVPRLFQSGLGNRWAMPTKLIVATSEPTTVEGRRARDDEDTQDKTPQAFCFLDLTRPFIYPGGPRDFDCDFRKNEERLQLVDFRCRLDISGDVHHYARYWGDGETVGDYASVVAGGGGASMSPTQTDYDEVEEQVIYPGKEVSTRAVNKQLFKPWVVISGGNVWMAGLIIAMLVYLGASLPNHREFTSAVLFGLAQFVSKFFASLDVPEPGTSFLSYLPQFGRVGKFLALLVTSGVAVVCAGLYARWLFERLTKTYDWATNKRENLRLGKQKRSQEELDVFFKRRQVFGDLLDKISAQKNAGVHRSTLLKFWGIALLGPICAGLLWILEFSLWPPKGGLVYCALFSLLLVFVNVCSCLLISFPESDILSSKELLNCRRRPPQPRMRLNEMKTMSTR